MPVFERSDEIFRDEDILTDNYSPANLDERDAELEEYKALLQPVIEGSQPPNIFLYGKTGVGKTVATKYLFEHLERDAQQYDDLQVTTTYLNCEDAQTSYQVAIKLVNNLREIAGQSPISTTGYPLREVYNKLWDVLDAIGGTVLITLDEVDYLGDDDSILYQIPRARAHDNIQTAKVGIVGISNDYKFKEQLDARVLDTLAEEQLQFPPYNASQLRSILGKRAERAFEPEVVDQGIIGKCAALAARDKGSARQALRLLLFAGKTARRAGADRVVIDHVDTAHRKLQQEEINRGMQELTAHGKLTLAAVIALQISEPNSRVTKNEVYSKYQEVATRLGTDPLTANSIHRHLSDLALQSILSKEESNKGKGGGRRYLYELNVPIEDALVALEGSIDGLDIEALREAAIAKGVIDPPE